MSDNTMLQGLILGMKQSGGKFIKIEGDKIYFTIEKYSTLDNPETLKIAKMPFKSMFGLRMFIKKVKTHNICQN